jgi:hypothetical protein
MRKFLTFGVALLVLAFPAMAQDDNAPKVEVFAGYSFLSVDTTSLFGERENFPTGFNADIAFNATRNFALVVDFQGHFKTFEDPGFPDIKIHAISFHTGPRLKVRSGKVEPFVHGLFGFTNLKAEQQGFFDDSENAFSVKAGGGFDVVASKHIAIRLVEFNYYMTRFFDDSQNNFTFSTGIVFRLGGD